MPNYSWWTKYKILNKDGIIITDCPFTSGSKIASAALFLVLSLFKIVNWVIGWKCRFERINMLAVCRTNWKREGLEDFQVWKDFAQSRWVRKGKLSTECMGVIPPSPVSSVLNNLGSTTRIRWASAFSKFSVSHGLSYLGLATSDGCSWESQLWRLNLDVPWQLPLHST